MRTVLAMSGTSIWRNTRPERESEFSERNLRKYLRNFREKHPDDIRRLLSAETHSFEALGIKPGDEIVLFHTDTELGKSCALVLAWFVRKDFNCSTHLIGVPGLQVEDEREFRTKGIQELYSCLDKQTTAARASGSEVILNTTGGFKSVVPYVTLFGLLRGLPVTYIFERSDNLMTLPPAPLNIDYNRASLMADFLRKVERETAVSMGELEKELNRIPYSSKDWYKSLFEILDDEVTLSAFGLMVLGQARTSTGSVKLSHTAVETYKKSSGDSKKRLTHMLDKIGNPLWRNSHIDEGWSNSTEFQVIKLRRNSERIACIPIGQEVRVCLMYVQHKEYERTLPGTRRSDFKNVRFVDWYRVKDHDIGSIEHPLTEEADIHDSDELLIKNDQLESEKYELERSVKSMSNKVSRLREEMSEKDRILAKAKKRAQVLERKVKEQGQELDYYRRGGMAIALRALFRRDRSNRITCSINK